VVYSRPVFKLPWQKKQSQIADLAFVVEEAISRLPNAHQRMRLLELSHVNACLSVLDQTHRRGTSSENPTREEIEAAKQFWEEVNTIAAVMAEKGVMPIPLKGPSDEFHVAEESEQNRLWASIQAWSWYAIPWRVVGKRVCVIVAPNYGPYESPDIRSFPVAEFLVMVANAMFPSQRNKDRP
jgi:hypothetical protein